MKGETSSKKSASSVLGNLPESYDNFITSLNARNAEELNSDGVKGLLVEEFAKRKEKKEKTLSEGTLFIKQGAVYVRRGQSREDRGYNSFRGSQGSRLFVSKGKDQQQFTGRSGVTEFRCIKCNQVGHIVKNCTQNKRYSAKHEHSNNAEFSNGEDSFEVEDMALLSGTKASINEWFIDSGATKHMTCNSSLLFDFKQYDHPLKIYLGESSVVLAEGEGKVPLPTYDGLHDNFLALHNLLFVPKLTKNLLSVPAMAQMGAEICFDKEKCTVIKNGKKITIGHMLNGKLFRVNTPEFAHLSTMSNILSLDMWHQRLGHLNHEHINQLKKKDLVDGLEIDKNTSYEKNCESCALGKMHGQSFPKWG